MSELKPISRKAISSALEEAVRYRLLNEPRVDEYCDSIKKLFRMFRGRT